MGVAFHCKATAGLATNEVDCTRLTHQRGNFCGYMREDEVGYPGKIAVLDVGCLDG